MSFSLSKIPSVKRFCLLSLVYILNVVFLGYGQGVIGQETTSVITLLPKAAQGYVRVIDMPRLRERWDTTELAKFAKDPALKSFWEDQRQDIETRLADAGWQLNIEAARLVDVASGEAVLSWIANPENRRKPYALALIVDVAGRTKDTEEMLASVDKQLKGKGATAKSLKVGAETVLQYTLPRKPGELLLQETFYSIAKDRLIASDDLALVEKMLAAQVKPSADSLVEDTDYQTAIKRVDGLLNRGEIEYFVRPIGLARVIREISGKREGSRSTDVLKVLEDQGFGHFRAVAGRVEVGADGMDMLHQGAVIAPKPLPGSAAIVNTPNEVSWKLPDWIGGDVSAMINICWNIQESFWKSEGLMDGLADSPGVFKQFVKGMAENETGPKVDIAKEVLPYLTNDIISLSDCKEPITVDSRRTMIALRVLEPEKLFKVLERVMNNEPDAKLVEFEGHKLWKVVREDSAEGLEIDAGDLGADFGEFGDQPMQSKPEDEPWLSNWAITIYGDQLMFASHAELIQDCILQAKSGKPSPLASDVEYVRARKAIEQLANGRTGCSWQVLRSDLSYRVQYELFREGKLPQSQSMAATIMERLTQPKKELRGKEKQQIDGTKLPPFDQIRGYLQPGGMMFESTDDGWVYTGFLLSAPK
ncbi:MAG: hypothetical protein JNK90_23030 [Planctomycetaceae bacterium]|nr:hypothetical protein [Planctomycetaceae bacterium]MBN8604951.1 hypothetical protein [Planctomycetota bacterium]